MEQLRYVPRVAESERGWFAYCGDLGAGPYKTKGGALEGADFLYTVQFTNEGTRRQYVYCSGNDPELTGLAYHAVSKHWKHCGIINESVSHGRIYLISDIDIYGLYLPDRFYIVVEAINPDSGEIIVSAHPVNSYYEALALMRSFVRITGQRWERL